MRYPEDRPLDLGAIASGLHTKSMGRTVVYFQSTGSTNDDAKSMGARYPDGTLFITEVQTGGKGRIGRLWSSPPGGIFMSLALRPEAVPPSLPTLSIAAGYCVASTIREDLGLDAALKWPNDVLVSGRKVCGILCESTLPPGEAPLVVVGIGVNANLDVDRFPPEVQKTASSLAALQGHPVDREMLIAAILDRFEPAYMDFLDNGLANLTPQIGRIAAFVGQRITIGKVTMADSSSTEGIFRGIDAQGRAIVEIPGGERVAFSAGDLSLKLGAS